MSETPSVAQKQMVLNPHDHEAKPSRIFFPRFARREGYGVQVTVGWEEGGVPEMPDTTVQRLRKTKILHIPVSE